MEALTTENTEITEFYFLVPSRDLRALRGKALSGQRSDILSGLLLKTSLFFERHELGG